MLPIEIIDETRSKIAKFINARYPEEIIYTKNATESLNLIACSYGLSNLKKGDEIVLIFSVEGIGAHVP